MAKQLNQYFKRKKNKIISIGWVISENFLSSKYYLLNRFKTNNVMRFNPSMWINENRSDFISELYIPFKKYDIVVFLKIMSDRAIKEAKKIRSRGGLFVFDANVNYYEVWGEYTIPGTKPTDKQKSQAEWMTENADYVVADSSYLEKICRQYNKNVIWIPDNINVTEQYTGSKTHSEKKPLTAIWSGIAKKAFHFELIENVLSDFAEELHMIIVTRETEKDRLPAVICRLKNKFSTEIRCWDSNRYPDDLLQSDFIISPKILNNGYVLGHSEYKISLGMAQRLPVIASRQPSYLDAVGDSSVGYICENENEWHRGLKEMLTSSPEKRQAMGDFARARVINNYALDVVSHKYLSVFNELIQ